MARFLITIPHEEEELACARAVKVLLETGSHYLTNAEFGCMDGDHRAWIIVEGENKEEALAIVPPVFRSNASVVQLNRFSLEWIDDFLRHHK
jgi:hypothetical protein